MDLIKVIFEAHLPLVIGVGLLGFFLILALSNMSAKSDGKAIEMKEKGGTKTRSSANTPPATPTKKSDRISSNGTPVGTIQTPAGRRSARIAKSRRKEE